MSVSWEKVRPVGQFEILAQDNLFLSKVRLVGQFFLRSCPTGRTLVYVIFWSKNRRPRHPYQLCDLETHFSGKFTSRESSRSKFLDFAQSLIFDFKWLKFWDLISNIPKFKVLHQITRNLMFELKSLKIWNLTSTDQKFEIWPQMTENFVTFMKYSWHI